MDIERLLSKAAEDASVRRAFGPVIESEGTLIIPVAWVAGGGGGGDDGGRDTENGDTETGHAENGQAENGRAAAGGGGFGSVTWPLGVYEVKDGRVRWVPAVDATRVVLAGLAIVRAVVKLRTLSRVKALKRMRRRD